MPMTLQQWLERAPTLRTSYDPLRHTYRQSLIDLAALRFRPSDRLRWSLPAAGLPWFMTLFGRDSLITGYQALPFHPELAQTTLAALAELQATDHDDFRDADPGKIVHELRRGELAALGETPSPYYGTHDATPLFLILLDEYERWSGDRDLVARLEPAARAALGWIEGPGDPDVDGYLEYRTRSPKGLRNQCWKDSWNSIRFADGRIAEPPIATCELQGYAYDARRRAARLARLVWDDAALADRLERDAAALRERFDRAEARLPVEYPTACQPQAWAAGTPLLAVRTLLGLDVVDGHLRADPTCPRASPGWNWTGSRSQAATETRGASTAPTAPGSR
jgi:glycogen debranching enzyme